MNFPDYLKRHGYELAESEPVAEGGSAEVYKARVSKQSGSLQPGTFVAAKRYKLDLLKVPGQLERVKQEFQIGSSLDSPNVVKAHRLLQSEGAAVLIMEWIAGETLENWRTRQKQVAWENLQSICLAIVTGVEALHARKVCHRDIKPENVMIADNGRVVLMDIGVSEITSNSEHTMHTRISDFIGSVRTSSPQFLSGDQFETSDDVYSLGATCHFALSGKQIFSEVDRKPLIPVSVMTYTPEIAAFGADVPEWITTLVAGALSKDRRHRPRLEQFKEALEASAPTDYTTSQASKLSLDRRGMPVVHAEYGSGNFFVEVGRQKLVPNSIFKVVRRGPKITLPASNRVVQAERMICRAQLKHVSDGLAHLCTVEPEGAIMKHGTWNDIVPSESIELGDYVLPDAQ